MAYWSVAASTNSGVIGRVFDLDGVQAELVREHWYGTASQRHYVNFIATPTRRGKESAAYKALRAQLGDDWITDLTNSERLIDCMRLAGLNDRDISEELNAAHALRMASFQ